MILPEGTFTVSPLQAHRIERLLHDEAARLQRNGVAMRPEVVELLRDVRLSAAVYRRRVIDENVTVLSEVLAPQRKMDIGEVAALALAQRHAVAEQARRGRLVGHKASNRWWFYEADVFEWLAKRKEIA